MADLTGDQGAAFYPPISVRQLARLISCKCRKKWEADNFPSLVKCYQQQKEEMNIFMEFSSMVIEVRTNNLEEQAFVVLNRMIEAYLDNLDLNDLDTVWDYFKDIWGLPISESIIDIGDHI